MHEEELQDLSQCEDCRVETSATLYRGYVFSDAGVLCFECAIRRGGVYDGAKERWTRAPDIADLMHERRPAL